ncbi:MAG: hypothetical protein US63_C0026G0010 [Candidatus Moranbacteria bacterium GW2011_GWC2_37_8]|nr:MAG: hypothetical protein US63_C0026G0010 [Candidatus Moranbacteria bacterium GW2011_GWC2_37_8]KKQ62893.1 MAG: hypothetical protein US82_C0004G0010 [Parcubacteria group bacterium GW2011_GWC1_38_22]KKQ81477.1 MAG: hypothetical protein UT03_C0001G0017 [Candidatus Moranbacteria bacterium GW2011_GWD2_38_7]
MSFFESHPFLAPHEIPNSKPIEKASEKEASLNAVKIEKENPTEKTAAVFQPFDRRINAAKFNASGFAKYIEILPEPGEENAAKTNVISAKQLPLRSFEIQNHTTDFKNHPAIKESEKLYEAHIAREKAEKNLKLFKSRDIDEIISFLNNTENEDLEFQKEIKQTKTNYAEQLASATFLDSKDWKILTGLRLFNMETFEHSIGTYLIAKNKIKERLTEIGIEIQHEGVRLEQFYRACLFHDIGKMAIPDFVLSKKATNLDWVTGFMTLDEEERVAILVEKDLPIPNDIIYGTPQDMTNYLEKERIRAIDFVPAKTLFNPEEVHVLKDIYPEMAENDSLKSFLRIHEKKSEEILQGLGFILEAFLAGNHHNYKHADKKLGEKPATLSALHISIEIASTILHLADIQQALDSNRSYHSKHNTLRIMAFLVDDAKNEIIDSKLTARWIKDEMLKITPEELNEIRNMHSTNTNDKDLKMRHEDLMAIENFLEKNLQQL